MIMERERGKEMIIHLIRERERGAVKQVRD